MEMLRWARARRCPWDSRTFKAAAEGGHVEVLIWARAHKCPWEVVSEWEELEWARELVLNAAHSGRVEVLKWLIEFRENCEDTLDEGTTATAAIGGHLETLKLLREHGCLWEAFTCECAAEFGHRVEVVAGRKLPLE